MDSRLHKAFLASPRKHVLMITNHGIHQWQIIPGLPDTGGQNVFVNQFTHALTKLGFKITIANRGGYRHPVSGEWHTGIHYRDAYQRILYLEDGLPEFVRKEDMDARIPELVRSLARRLREDATPVDLIVSHYWDGAKIGVLLNEVLPAQVRHIWVPHSLGAIKKRNVSPDQWSHLRIDERIVIERGLVPDLDGIVATSSAIRQSLNRDYGYTGPELFLPPCVDTERYHPREVVDEDPIWDFLARQSGLSPQEVRGRKIVTEISRTDATKRKDVLIRAFARVRKTVPDSLLVVSIDDRKQPLAGELRRLIDTVDLDGYVAVVGSIWQYLPALYAITAVYCTPSIMEGFGMSAQEAAATAVPVVASHLVPFVTEYLLGGEVEQAHHADARSPLAWGRGAVAVQADDANGFARALETLLRDDALRHKMGLAAYRITVPYFTWPHRVTDLLDQIGMAPGRSGESMDATTT